MRQVHMTCGKHGLALCYPLFMDCVTYTNTILLPRAPLKHKKDICRIALTMEPGVVASLQGIARYGVLLAFVAESPTPGFDKAYMMKHLHMV